MKFKSSNFSRNASLLKLAGKVIVSEIKEKILDLDAAQQIQEKVNLAKKMSQELGSLKGAAMKLGQMLSLDAADLLPPEAVEIFGKLQKDATPVEFGIIETILKTELKEKYHQLQIDPTPIATASIGQVYKANFEGKQIVLKVQFPGLEKTIENDIKLLRLLLSQTSFLLGKSLNLDSLFNELRTTLLNETDFLREGEKMMKAQDFFQKDPRFTVPTWYQDLSTRRVLAMEFKEGISITEWLKSDPIRSRKNEIGKALYELFLEEFLNLGMVQTDPNPGNFLINGNGQIVILDFGATKEYDQEFREKYKSILRAAYGRDKKQVIDLSIKFNLINEKEQEDVFDYFYEMMDCMVSPFRFEGDFDFTDQDYYQRSKEYALNISKKCKYSPPPEKILFLHRKLGGIFQLLKKMNMKMNVHNYWLTHLA